MKKRIKRWINWQMEVERRWKDIRITITLPWFRGKRKAPKKAVEAS